MGEGFFKTGSPTSCHDLKHKSTDSALLEPCCWPRACGRLTGGRHITTHISECQGGARDEEEAVEKVPPQRCPHLNICTTVPLLSRETEGQSGGARPQRTLTHRQGVQGPGCHLAGKKPVGRWSFDPPYPHFIQKLATLSWGATPSVTPVARFQMAPQTPPLPNKGRGRGQSEGGSAFKRREFQFLLCHLLAMCPCAN